MTTIQRKFGDEQNSETDKSYLPTVEMYRKYLNIASFKFNLTLDECRDLYGMFTENQWLNLLNK